MHYDCSDIIHDAQQAKSRQAPCSHSAGPGAREGALQQLQSNFHCAELRSSLEEKVNACGSESDSRNNKRIPRWDVN